MTICVVIIMLDSVLFMTLRWLDVADVSLHGYASTIIASAMSKSFGDLSPQTPINFLTLLSPHFPCQNNKSWLPKWRSGCQGCQEVRNIKGFKGIKRIASEKAMTMHSLHRRRLWQLRGIFNILPFIQLNAAKHGPFWVFSCVINLTISPNSDF